MRIYCCGTHYAGGLPKSVLYEFHLSESYDGNRTWGKLMIVLEGFF